MNAHSPTRRREQNGLLETLRDGTTRTQHALRNTQRYRVRPGEPAPETTARR